MYVLTIPRWHPTRLNQLLGHWSRAARLKKTDRQMVVAYARQAGLPPAIAKRRVGLLLTLAPRQRAGDPDCYWKSLLDALVTCGLLIDDNRQGVELTPVEFTRGPMASTKITLRDIPIPLTTAMNQCTKSNPTAEKVDE